MGNAQWYVVVIHRWGEDMVEMCIKLSGYNQIYMPVLRVASCESCCKVVKILARIQALLIFIAWDVRIYIYMFRGIQTESRGFLSVVFCLTNLKLLPPPL